MYSDDFMYFYCSTIFYIDEYVCVIYCSVILLTKKKKKNKSAAIIVFSL